MTDKAKRCHFWNHDWTPWEDTHSLEKFSTIHKGLIDSGIQQERRCKNCNKIQLRVEWLTK